MDEPLTPQELKIINLIESSGRRDHLIHGLSLLIPCFVIVGMGVWFSKLEIVVAGALAYCIIRIWTLARQDKLSACLRSALRKLRKQAAALDEMA